MIVAEHGFPQLKAPGMVTLFSVSINWGWDPDLGAEWTKMAESTMILSIFAFNWGNARWESKFL